MQNTSGKKMAKNTLFLSMRMVVVLVISLYTSRVFLNVLGVVDYGINNVVAGFVSIFSFMNTALSNGVQRFYNYEMGVGRESSITKIYNTSLFIQVILALIVVILLETVGLWYLYNKMVIPEERFDAAFWLFQISVISTFIIIMQIPYSAAILAYEKMNWYAFVNIFDVGLKLVFAFLIPFIPFDKLIVFGLFTLLVSVISFLLYVIYAKKNFKPLYFIKGLDYNLFKEMLSFSGWNFFGSLAGVGRSQGLNMILNIFFGPIVNAARGVAFQVSNAIQGFVGSLGMAVKPQMISSFASGQLQRTIALMYSISKVRFYILYVLALPICLEVDFILKIWLGNAVPEHTEIFVILSLFMYMISNFNAPVSDVVHATGVIRNYQVCTSIISLSVLPVSYILMKVGGAPEWVFIMDIIFVTLNQFVALLIFRRLVPFSIKDYIFRCIFPLVVCFVLSAVIPTSLRFIMISSWFRLVIIVICSVIMVSVIFYWIGLNKEERNIAQSLVLSILSKFSRRK